MEPCEIERETGLTVYAGSICEAGGATYFLGRRGSEKFVGTVGRPGIAGRQTGRLDGRPVVVGPLDHENACRVRRRLAWTAPRLIGLRGSIGMGDRLGLATPGHVRAARGSGLACILAQQSMREMTRTRRTPEDVMDCVTWGVLQEGFREGFGSDADHLHAPADVDATAKAGFTMFTIDPGAHVDDEADTLGAAALAERYARLPFDSLETTPGDLKRSYVGKPLPIAVSGGAALAEETLVRAAVKYGRAIAHSVRMQRHLKQVGPAEFELEVSVDETQSPTSAAEHYLFALELRRLGVEWVSLAPRFVGRFEKGVDYIGELGEFRRAFAEHVAVMRALGPYKISVHTGSDKFRLYPIVSELADGLVHVKTAGTSYLCALETIARLEPALFREILGFARERYEEDRTSYHVSADITNVPLPDALDDAELPALVRDFHAREALHVTFGSVLTADGGERFGARIRQVLQDNEEAHYAALAAHLGRHVELLKRR